MRYVFVHDTRVVAGVPARPNLGIINTGEMTPLSHVFARINGFARPGPIHVLFILAHGKAGFDAKPATDQVHSYMRPGGICMDAGGMGVKLGAEGIRHYNVDLWRAIRGRVDNIVLFSCAAADTQPGNEGTLADGKYLMGALAIRTGATVYAANRIQYFRTYHKLKHGRFIHDEWQGQLIKFEPSGGPSQAVPNNRIPFDLGAVMAGKAV